MHPTLDLILQAISTIIHNKNILGEIHMDCGNIAAMYKHLKYISCKRENE
jgi:hypothetical protein